MITVTVPHALACALLDTLHPNQPPADDVVDYMDQAMEELLVGYGMKAVYPQMLARVTDPAQYALLSLLQTAVHIDERNRAPTVRFEYTH